MDLGTVLKQSKDIEFQDVFYTVTQRKHIVKVTGRRDILCGVSGAFRNGELSAILGPSGAGKSSLLNAISGYRTSGVSGQININRDNSCFITQEDNIRSGFTLGELMHLACELKMKNRQNRNAVINDILENLNLNHRRNVTAEKLSGGERKRLSIAMELVANPTIFFLDEPTSGLDEVTAAQCIRLLSHLAKQGRTIVCTIHQPSATVFNYFDNVYVLARGQCVYQGSPTAVIPFLKHVNLSCPMYYSPSDYIIELCDSEEGKLISFLAEVTHNGKLIYVPTYLNDDLSKEQNHKSLNAANDNFNLDGKNFRNAVTTMFFDQTKYETSQCYCGLAGANALLGRMKFFSKTIAAAAAATPSDRQCVSGFRQFCVLLRMMILKIARARIALLLQVFYHLTCAIGFGSIFFKAANDGDRMFDHLKLCIGIVLTVVYTQVMVPILSFPSEVKIVKKETFNRWYSLTPYYMALTLSRVPLQLILNLVFLSITYFMTGLPYQLWRFSLFALVGIMTSFVAEGMGLAIGATFSITNGSAVGPLLITPFMGLAVYGFDFAAEIPTFMTVLMKFSYIRVAVVSLILTIFGFNREQLDCDKIYCHFDDPRVLMRFLQLEHTSLASEFGFLAGLLVFFRILLFVSLQTRCRT